jgi:hypothetical protein
MTALLKPQSRRNAIKLRIPLPDHDPPKFLWANENVFVLN